MAHFAAAHGRGFPPRGYWRNNEHLISPNHSVSIYTSTKGRPHDHSRHSHRKRLARRTGCSRFRFYYGIHTQRAIQNFPISGQPLPQPFIHAHVLLKKAAATVNRDLALLKPEFANAIIQAADEILADTPWSLDQFPVDIYQTGSGTSTNMNVNEVLASRANEILGLIMRLSRQSRWKPAAVRPCSNLPRPITVAIPHCTPPIHPNDHVNMGQSSNDTYSLVACKS